MDSNLLKALLAGLIAISLVGCDSGSNKQAASPTPTVPLVLPHSPPAEMGPRLRLASLRGYTFEGLVAEWSGEPPTVIKPLLALLDADIAGSSATISGAYLAAEKAKTDLVYGGKTIGITVIGDRFWTAEGEAGAPSLVPGSRRLEGSPLDAVWDNGPLWFVEDLQHCEPMKSIDRVPDRRIDGLLIRECQLGITEFTSLSKDNGELFTGVLSPTYMFAQLEMLLAIPGYPVAIKASAAGNGIDGSAFAYTLELYLTYIGPNISITEP